MREKEKGKGGEREGGEGGREGGSDEEAGKRGIFGDEKRWMEEQHVCGEKDVLFSR